MASVPAFSLQVALLGEISDRFSLKQPLVVDLEVNNDGGITASDNVFYIYGTGTNRKEALRDYVTSLCEYYELISEYDDKHAAGLFNFLQSYLQPIST